MPPSFGGIQVNHCKNPLCRNYFTEAKQYGLGRSKLKEDEDEYLLIGGMRQKRVLVCRACKQSTVVHNNRAIAQEAARFDPVKYRLHSASCPRNGCTSEGQSVGDAPTLYATHGKTRFGEPRLRCRACGSTFTAGTPIRKQRRPELDASVFVHLVNKVPMRRICEILDLNPATLYSKIGYLAEICAHFSSRKESLLASGACSLRRAYVSVDRQDHMLNWASQLDRRFTKLGAIGAVENVTGYVLAMQLNVDPSCDPEDVEADAIARGDYDLPPSQRHYARLWLRRDYEARRTGEKTSVDEELDAEDITVAETQSKPPSAGMQVRLELMNSGLFFHLKGLLSQVEKVRFFIDRDPGLDGACLAAFKEEVRDRRADLFLVQNGKNLSVDKKKLVIAKANNELLRFSAKHAGSGGRSQKLMFVMDRLEKHRALKNESDWFEYPLADMADAQKAIRYLTDHCDMDLEHLANLYMRASLRGIDKFFMQVRRRLSILERPISSANNAQQRWYGYSAYSPLVAQQLLGIFKVYYNFCLKGEDKKTPAMRIGLATQPLTVEALVASFSRGAM